jgi:ligand-binding sensor domain-containing protein
MIMRADRLGTILPVGGQPVPMTFAAGVSRFSILALAVLLLPAALFSLDPGKSLTQFAHRTWGLEEGLLQPTIYAIEQTPDGFIWLGTQDSLVRFDGVHFREWQHRGAMPLHGSLVHALLSDSSGALWVGSIGGSLVRIASQSEGRTIRKLTERDGMPSPNVWCLANGDERSIWACTDKGLVHWDGSRLRTYSRKDGLPDDFVRFACEASDGTRWVAGNSFTLAYSAGERFVSYI